MNEILQKVRDRLDEKDPTAFVSRHEILDTVIEGYREFIDVVLDKRVFDEFLVHAVICAFGMACFLEGIVGEGMKDTEKDEEKPKCSTCEEDRTDCNRIIAYIKACSDCQLQERTREEFTVQKGAE